MPRKLSDTNIPMNIKDNEKIIRKYSSRKLKTEPNELQRYNEYLTKKKPTLDEANYVASRRKDKKTKKKEEDFEFIQELKDKRREKLASSAEKRIVKDITPTILTDAEIIDEMKLDTNNSNIIAPVGRPPRKEEDDLFSTLEGIFPTMKPVNKPTDEIQQIIKDVYEKIPKEKAAKKIQGAIREKLSRNAKKNEVDKAFEDARKEVEKDQAIKQLQAVARRREIEPLYKKGKEIREEEAASKIEKAILGKVKRMRAGKIQKGLEEQIRKNEVNRDDGDIIPESRLAKALKKKNLDLFELTRGTPEIVRRGRPVGSKNKK